MRIDATPSRRYRHSAGTGRAGVIRSRLLMASLIPRPRAPALVARQQSRDVRWEARASGKWGKLPTINGGVGSRPPRRPVEVMPSSGKRASRRGAHEVKRSARRRERVSVARMGRATCDENGSHSQRRRPRSRSTHRESNSPCASARCEHRVARKRPVDCAARPASQRSSGTAGCGSISDGVGWTSTSRSIRATWDLAAAISVLHREGRHRGATDRRRDSLTTVNGSLSSRSSSSPSPVFHPDCATIGKGGTSARSDGHGNVELRNGVEPGVRSGARGLRCSQQQPIIEQPCAQRSRCFPT